MVELPLLIVIENFVTFLSSAPNNPQKPGVLEEGGVLYSTARSRGEQPYFGAGFAFLEESLWQSRFSRGECSGNPGGGSSDSYRERSLKESAARLQRNTGDGIDRGGGWASVPLKLKAMTYHLSDLLQFQWN